MGKQTFIHYGNDKFQPELFEEIKNFTVKPSGGFWGSPINSKYDWKYYCSVNDLDFTDFNKSFRFQLSDDARLLIIDNIQTLSKEVKIIEELNYFHPDFWVYSDFEDLKTRYDAVLVYITGPGIQNALYGWDCDSILILNKEVIKPI